MYLFTSGTSFEAEKGYNAFAVYAHLVHNNNFTAASNDLYTQGYGDRRAKLEDPIVEVVEEVEDKNELSDEYIKEHGSFKSTCPIDSFPPVIEDVLGAVKKEALQNVDFVVVGLLSAVSGMIGNAYKYQTTKYVNTCTMWGLISAVSGQDKTNSIMLLAKTVKKISDFESHSYEMKKMSYEGLTDDEKKIHPVPIDKSFWITSSTMEALGVDFSKNPRGVIWHSDEIKTFFGSLGQYTKGKGDGSKAIQMYNGEPIKEKRKAEGNSVYAPFVSLALFGTIQPANLDPIYYENKDSGMMYRFNVIEGEGKKRNRRITDEEIDFSGVEALINKIYLKVANWNPVAVATPLGDMMEAPVTHKLSPDALEYHLDVCNKYDDMSSYNKDLTANQREMYSKGAMIFCKITLLLTILWEQPRDVNVLMLKKAEKLTDWLLGSHAKLIKRADKTTEIKDMMESRKSAKDKAFLLFKGMSDLRNSDIAKAVGSKEGTIKRYRTEFNRQAKAQQG